MTKTRTAGELAEQAGVSVRTLHYYDKTVRIEWKPVTVGLWDLAKLPLRFERGH